MRCGVRAGVPVVSLPKSGDTASGDARTRQWREIGLGAQILADLGVHKICLLTANPRKIAGLLGFGLEVQEHVPLTGKGAA